MRNIIRFRLQPAAAAAAAFALLALGNSADAEAFDIKAEFLHGATVECEGSGNFCTPLEIQMRFTNIGSAPTDRPYRVSLQRFNGPRATGRAVRHGGSRALETIPVLQPGQSVTLSWAANRTGAHEYTFQPRYSPALNDKNNANHRISQTITAVVKQSTMAAASASQPRSSPSQPSPSSSQSSGGAFDIKAEFLHGGTIDCPGSGAFCTPLEISMKFTNVGSAPSDRPYRVSLRRFTGDQAGGYAVRHGGSRALETIPVLQPGQSVTLSWSANRVRAAQYTFRPSYSPALNDANNDNHRITETFNVVVQN